MLRCKVVICPGIHSRDLTDRFVEQLRSASCRPLHPIVFCTQQYPAYSGYHLLQVLDAWQTQHGTLDRLSLIGFSAGVVAAAIAAWEWRRRGRMVNCLIALDGWGVPLYGDFPIYRLSHDRFTDWSSSLLGAGTGRFFADPPVAHLDLWRSPQDVRGQAIDETGETRSTTALDCIVMSMSNEQ